MITVKNYKEESAKIDFSKLPEKYGKVHEFINEALDFYGQDPEIDKTINEGIKQLNEQAAPKKEAKPKSAPAAKKAIKEHIEKGLKKHEEADHKEEKKAEKQAKAGTEAVHETPEQAAALKEQHKKEVESELQKIVSGGDMSMSEIVSIGRRINGTRSFRSQFIDNGSDNKRRLTPTKENLVRWMKAPGRFDLIGVDTASATDATADLKHVKKETILHLLGFKNKGESK